MLYKVMGVVGAGIMGSDVALDLALNDITVLLHDLTDQALDTAVKNIESRYRMVKMVKGNKVEKTIHQVLNKIKPTTSYDRFEDANAVIENVTESLEIKKKVYQQLRDVCKTNTVYGVNTSCISITKIASLMPEPDKVIGAHFMNPVPLNEMVEVIRGVHTSKQIEKEFTQFLIEIKKSPIVVNDFPGFVANRLSHLFMNEAAFLVQDNVASPEEIDNIFKKGYGHRMGPCETADLIGLDTVANSLDVLLESYSDPKFRCSPYLRKLVDAGFLGKKSGRGFYEY